MRNKIMCAIVMCLGISSAIKGQSSKQVDYAIKFVDQFIAYKMDISAAGMANIPMAKSVEGKNIVIDYSYESGNESRSGSMEITYSSIAMRYEGGWETKADNGNVYSGTLYFVFSENGEATGKYQFSGSDYDIKILKK